MNPDQLVAFLHDDLKKFAKEVRGQITLAADPLHFLELLAQAPGSCHLVLHWAGDENQAAAGLPVPFNRNELHVGVTLNFGLAADRGEAAIRKRPNGGASLLKLVQLTRERVRTLVFPEGSCDRHAVYLGADPAIMPDGMPLSGYRLRFAITTADEAATPRG